jgi:hypothetical protein
VSETKSTSTCTITERLYLDALSRGAYADLKRLEARITQERLGLDAAGLTRLRKALKCQREASEELLAARTALLAGASGIPAAQALEAIEEELIRSGR